jgi:NAD(P)H-hydrate epimerase
MTSVIVTASEMADMDRYTIETLGIPGVVLMENAGRGVYEVCRDLLGSGGKHVTVLCGPGNNGGDGFVIARHCLNNGCSVSTILLTSRDKIKGDARTHLDILEAMDHPVKSASAREDIDLSGTDLVVDAILGTGVKGALRGFFAEVAEVVNRWSGPVVSVDLPTGVDADTGAVEGPAVRATRTATMALKKRGLLFSPGREAAGEVTVVDIGMPHENVRDLQPDVVELTGETVADLLPRRTPDAYKNTCGTVAVIAGSEGLTGAAVLTSEAVLRAGAGLCYLCTPQSLNPVLESKLTEVITWPFDDAGTGFLHSGSLEEIYNHVSVQSAVAVGPGLGQHRKTGELLTELLQRLSIPMVLDADGLNLCAHQTDLIKAYGGALVLTPHPGELSRLTGLPSAEILKDRIGVVRRFAREWDVVLVLKGAPTVIGHPDGAVRINSTGNAGMATGGTGDVLTGVIVSLMAQGVSAPDAACAGVYVHGAAGDASRDRVGEAGMVASDLLKSLPGVLWDLTI